MKYFMIKNEHLDSWCSVDWVTGVSEAEIVRLSKEWDKPLEELMDEVEEIEMPNRFWMVCSVRAWADGSGVMYDEVFHADYVDVNDIEDANPEVWYPEYCGYHRATGCDDAEVTVRLYPSDCDVYDLPYPVYEVSRWESEMGEWNEE